MNRWRRILTPVVFVVLGTGCILPEDIVRQRFAADTSCVERQIAVKDLPGSAYRADGCGLSATYVCTVEDGSTRACIRESAPQHSTVDAAGNQAH